jgi:flagellar basal-body rod protein FlgB
MVDMPNGGGLSIAEISLDALWLKQKVISGNLANIDTPGYKARDVDFEKIFKEALASSGKDTDNLAQSLDFHIVEDTSTQAREDGNNVDAVKENIELAGTQLQYEYMVRAVSGEISRLKYAINEGNA